MTEYLNAETLLRSAIINYRQDPDIEELPVSTEVPEDRPDRFITIGRTGGPSDRFWDRPQMAVQVWAESRWEAEGLASRLKTVLGRIFARHYQIISGEVTGSYEFNDPQQHRWQITCQMVTAAL